MADKAKIIEGLQTIVTDLEQQAAGHDIQSRVFASQGLSKLADKYKEHAEEERGYVQKCTDRILALGGEVKIEAKKAAPVYTDAIEYMKYDLQVSKDGLAWLAGLVECAREDYTTFDILKEYYQDEETDMYEAEETLGIIEKIGKENWYAKQM